MDALQGYGSSSDSEQEPSQPDSGAARQPQAEQAAQQSLRQPTSRIAPAPQPQAAVGVMNLPSAADLFGGAGSSVSTTPAGLRAAGGAVHKRQQPHGLRPGQQQPPKAQKGPAGGRPSRGGAGALVPPQLRGRANVVTEDLDRLFTKKAKSPPSAAAPSSAQSVVP